MNFKTTLALLVLAGAGVALYLVGGPSLPPQLDPAPKPPAAADAGSRQVLEAIQPAELTGIEVRRGDRVTALRRQPGGAWTMPGNWPTRSAEAQALADLLGGLRTRFEPLPLGEGDPKKYGLDKPALVVKVETDKAKHTLSFGEGAAGAESNRFSQPTYVRVDDKPEALRLGPGLIVAIDRPTDYYLQRRLFPAERVAKEGSAREKTERLLARGLALDEGKKDGLHCALAKKGDEWELIAPARDRLEPRTRDALLAAVPDVWAERFVNTDTAAVAAAAVPPAGPGALAAALYWTTSQGLLVKSGLAEPERTLAVTRDDGTTVTLLIGRSAGSRARKVPRPAPPNLPPGVRLPDETVQEEYRYAKLKDNEQIFEIKADGLKDVFVALDQLRDPQVARFNPADARRVELTHGAETIVLAKEKERWKLVKPLEADADAAKVNDVLDKLSALQARDKDVLDKADPKKYGLDKPGTLVRVTVEEEVKGENDADAKDKKKKTRTLAVRVGKHDTDAKKLYVQADDLPRVNAVEDSLAPLLGRPALAYRGKRVLDFALADVAKVEIDRNGQKVALTQGRGGWRLAAPFAADADAVKAEQVATGLGALEALEYVNDKPKESDLEAQYGLGKPALKVTLTFTDQKKPARTLLVGKARGGKPGYFAKLADAPAVFAVAADLHKQLDRDSLAYLPLHLWQVFPEDVESLRVRKGKESEYRLTRQGAGWQVEGPFTAAALPAAVQKLTNELSAPKAESYKAHDPKDLKPFGLDAPALGVTLKTKGGAEHTLLVGGPADSGARRYARTEKGTSVFVVSDALVKAADHAALDLLDPALLNIDPAQVEEVVSKAGDATLKLRRQDKGWQVFDAPGAPFAADEAAVAALEAVWRGLKAERFAAYGPKVEWAKYGLDKPAAVVTVRLKGEGAKPQTVEIGKPVQGESGARYARVNKGPGVAVLGAAPARTLARTYLDYVDHNVLKFDAGAVTQVRRRMGPDALDLAKRDDGWHIAKPAEQRGDDRAMQDLLGQLGGLRATRIAAYPAKDLKEYGLDTPAAVVTVTLSADGKPAERVLKLGKVADAATGERFALAGGKAVAVLPGAVAKRLTAAPLAFRDRTLARFADAERATLERGPRKATFSKEDGTWKLVEPLAAEADHDRLEDFIAALAKLRADELVAEKPPAAELKKYGLDRPEARWRLRAGDKDVLDLAVGNREKGGRRCYARLAGRDLVFLLGPTLSARVLAEYRPQTVWSPPLDAVQVVSLRYGQARNPFTLEKGEGETWQAVGKSDVKLNEATVNDTLAALSGLKLERYAVDKDADLKLFGLASPELVLEAATRSGKRALQIGGFVGESKARYARLPDKPGVFVLDEATAARLVRDLSAFTRPPGKELLNDRGPAGAEKTSE